MLDRFDEFNKPYGPFIPDLINKRFKYIIEVDGNIHDLPEAKERDVIKTDFYERNLYRVFRIVAFSHTSFLSVLDQVKKIK